MNSIYWYTTSTGLGIWESADIVSGENIEYYVSTSAEYYY